jgi:xanthine dehydrogenase accessory factor
LEEIKESLLRCQTVGNPCVIATIIEVDGSAYRREGARCLIMPDGEVTGILSGGCIEEELRGHADKVLKSGEACTVRYDFRTGEDDVWGTGIGCNGAIAVWLELFDPAGLPEEAERIVGDMRQRLDTRVTYEAVTVVCSSNPGSYPAGTRWTSPCSTYSGLLGAGQTAGIVQEKLHDIALELLVEEIAPRPELIIVGVGEDARLLCRMAKMLQWRVTILYHGTDRASRDRFPEADEIQIIPRLAFELADTRGKFAVIMTHQLELDREAVRKLLTEEIDYVGLVGSRYRLERILNELDTEEAGLSRCLLDKLYSPVGLDIGAETPQEIAMSIMAEMMAHRSGRSGSPLRNRKGIPLSHESARDSVRTGLRHV